MATPNDQIEYLIYNFGDVDVRRSPTHTRVQIVLTPFPFYDRLPVSIGAIGDTFTDATESLIRKLQAALVADPQSILRHLYRWCSEEPG